MSLKDTVDLMLSGDYKERLKAESIQLKIRIQKLDKYIAELENQHKRAEAEYKKKARLLEHFKEQRTAMENYSELLDKQLYEERIEISDEYYRD